MAAIVTCTQNLRQPQKEPGHQPGVPRRVEVLREGGQLQGWPGVNGRTLSQLCAGRAGRSECGQLPRERGQHAAALTPSLLGPAPALRHAAARLAYDVT